MTEIKHDIFIKSTPERIYEALTTAQGLKSWFTADVKGSGKIGTEWEMYFSDQPTFRWNILVSDKPHKVVWKCIAGPGNSPETEVEFVLKAIDGGQHTQFTIAHRGWRKDDPKFDRCVDIWRTLMNHLQHYCEQDVAKPAYQ